MKKNIKTLFVALSLSLFMTSCYTLSYSVGEGAQRGYAVTAKNHYLIYGLAPIATSNPQAMAGGAKNYTVITQHTFVDGLLNAITGGLYTPTTTTVIK